MPREEKYEDQNMRRTCHLDSFMDYEADWDGCQITID
uniref:Uncharacterized protein n=1 Tax=Arundo donax TaxID=35708 RepID=A0A0A9A2X5_ARUDO